MKASHRRRFLIVGGAGFIGSHFTDYLLRDPKVEARKLGWRCSRSTREALRESILAMLSEAKDWRV